MVFCHFNDSLFFSHLIGKSLLIGVYGLVLYCIIFKPLSKVIWTPGYWLCSILSGGCPGKLSFWQINSLCAMLLPGWDCKEFGDRLKFDLESLCSLRPYHLYQAQNIHFNTLQYFLGFDCICEHDEKGFQHQIWIVWLFKKSQTFFLS